MTGTSDGEGPPSPGPDRLGQPSAKDRVEASFAGEPESVSACRAFVQSTLVAWNCDDPGQIAVLLTSELVTNAVKHVGSDVRVGLALDVDVLEVDVADMSFQVPELRPFDSVAVGGKGMWLVDRLARAWGTRLTSEGKAVWFQVRVVRRGPLFGRPSQLS